MFKLIDVAKIMGVPVRTVRWWVTHGKLTAVKQKPSQGYPWLVSEKDLKQFMEDKNGKN